MKGKRTRTASPYVYSNTPMLSIVLQSFNHRDNIPDIVDSIRRTAADEVIVCEDGSSDGSERVWRRHLDRPNDFLIISNDLHEIRSYNRAVGLARGEFIVFLQDDDIPPKTAGWVSDAIELFRSHPKLAVLGCWNGCVLDLADFDESISYGPNDWEGTGRPVASVDPKSLVPFRFIDVVGIGPMFCRRKDFEALGGFDLRLAAPGEPGIWLDYDICLRAWISGRQVGLYETESFERNVGGRGTLLFGGAKRLENWRQNRAHVEREFGDRIDAVHSMIAELNASLRHGPDGAGDVA
jgi:glycosyltransferase involved in cell wall biosynthesis